MPSYLLKFEGKVSGPHSDIKLQEMASVRAFDESAELAPEATEDWKTIRDLPELMPRFFPPKKTITLKAKVVTTMPEASDEPITVDKILHDNLVAEAKIPQKKGKRHVNRRRRDFLFSFIFLNGGIAAAWHFLPHSKDYDTIAMLAGGFVTIGLYWVFYQMMDRY